MCLYVFYTFSFEISFFFQRIISDCHEKILTSVLLVSRLTQPKAWVAVQSYSQTIAITLCGAARTCLLEQLYSVQEPLYAYID